MSLSTIYISTDKSIIDIDYVTGFLANSYWSKGIPKNIVEKAIENSLCFGVYTENRQIGFARVITDFATYAYIADVFIDESEQGKGYGKMLMKTIMEHETLQGLRVWMLRTWDAHGLYEKFGFRVAGHPEHIMDKVDFNIYKKH